MTGNAQGGNFFSYKRYYFNVNCKKKKEREKRRYISGRQLDYQRRKYDQTCACWSSLLSYLL